MKINFFVLIVLAVVYCPSRTFSQDPRFAEISVEEFSREVDQTSDGDVQSEAIRGALNSGRPDLIRACYDCQGTQGYVENELIKFPEEPEKNAILLMILRTYPRRWADPARVQVGSRGVPIAIREPFTTFFKKYLPDVALEESLIATPEDRLNFADRLEAAMTVKPLPPKKTPPQFPPVSQKESHPPPPPDKAGAGTDKVGTGNSPAASGTKLFVPALWLIATIALGAISLVWWFLKKQK